MPRRQRPRTEIGRRRRAAARLSLYASLALVGGLLAAVYYGMLPSLDFGVMTGWKDVDWASRREVRWLQDYVAIDTSPSGNPAAGVEWVAARLREMGLEPTIEKVGGEANLWAIVEGEERAAVVLHHHVDVDPVFQRRRWVEGPFSGRIDGPWIYGRGTFDMKSVAVAQLLAVEKLLASGRRPRRSVIVLATTGEEHGSDLGTRWVLRQHPELVERFGVVLTEGGAVEGRTQESFKYWGTEFCQKRLVTVWLCSSEREPLAELDEEMRRTGGVSSEPKLVPEVETFLAAYAPTRDSKPLRAQLSDPRALLRDRLTFETYSAYLKSYFRNVAMPQGVFEHDGGWGLRIHVLLLPGEDPEAAVAELLPPWRTQGFAMSVLIDESADHGTSPDHWAFRTIGEVLRERRPDVPHGPLLVPTTLTDARFLRAAGVPTFGFSPFAVLTPDVLQLRYYGTVNERMSLPGFSEGVELYGEVLERLVE